MAQTKTTLTESWMLLLGRPLHEPERIEHNGGIYTAKLQNTFQAKNGDVIAVWVIDQYCRPTPQAEADQLRRTGSYQRRVGNFDLSRWYEELAHKAEREYPQAEGGTEFPGMVSY